MDLVTHLGVSSSMSLEQVSRSLYNICVDTFDEYDVIHSRGRNYIEICFDAGVGMKATSSLVCNIQCVHEISENAFDR